jgi:hypothetical protein
MSSLAIIGNIVGGGGGVAYALKGDGAAVYAQPASDILLVSGDTVKVTFKNSEAAGASNRFLFDGIDASATRGYVLQQNTTDLIGYSTGNASECNLDGVVVTSLVDDYPVDSAIHTVLLTASGNMTIGFLFTLYLQTAFSLSTIIQLQTNTVARGIETWNFNTRSLTVIEEEGTGVDINLFGVTADDWVRI